MALFVLLWGSAAIFTRIGLDHATPLAMLLLRFSLALLVLLFLCLSQSSGPRRWWPAAKHRKRVAAAGLLMIGLYSISYFQAMYHQVTPGLLATVLGVQPILTLLLTERRFSPWRLLGLLLALAGLALVVWQSLVAAQLSMVGMAYALAALLCITLGALLQKGVNEAPLQTLPMQYVITLLVCLLWAPTQAFEWQMDWGFWIPLLWLGIVISVLAQLLFYRLIQTGNLVNVTSLFYLVPVVTVVLDFLVLGNRLPWLALVGMAAILTGLALAFRQHAVSDTAAAPAATSTPTSTATSTPRESNA
ncbi:EamA family transporter [Bacterioplanes sanyensis]|uniref:EamA family transporter n=2 Tax=Bacterioplanes sanyensis TaxID=1249553 RepID=A0A222FIK1_9GAMM|nr:EamA family transporter [Bacterioplanes sanyensis]